MSSTADLHKAKVISARKAHMFAELTRINDSVKSSTLTALEAEVQLRACAHQEEAYNRISEEILTINVDLARDDRIPVKDLETIRVLIDAIVKYCTKAKMAKLPTAPAIATPTSDGNLPKLSLPSWDGDVSTWTDFKSQFDSLIHLKVNLKDVLKLQYLRSSLKGEPLAVVNQYPLTDASYALAYGDLEKRFQNNRRLASYHLFKMLNYKSASCASGKEHITFIEVHRSASAALKQLTIADLSEYIMFELAYQNLSATDQKGFDRQYTNTAVPSLKDLLSYVENIARSEELRMDKIPVQAYAPKEKKSIFNKRSLFTSQSKMSCFLCKDDHMLYRCPELEALSVPERKEKVQQLGCCISCLYRHTNKPCNSKYACKQCGSKKHNTVLHEEGPTTSAVCNNCVSQGASTVLLGTVQCRIKDNWGDFVPVRAILDPGSEVSCISSALVERLGLLRVKSQCEVIGITNSRSKSLGAVNLRINSKANDFALDVKAVILPTLCNPLPSVDLPGKVLEKFQHLPLADTGFGKSSPVELLLGAAAYCDVLSTDQPSIIKGEPSAIRTHFGFVIMGRTAQSSSSLSLLSTADSLPEQSYQALRASIIPLEDQLQRFWEVEEVSCAAPQDPEDVACEEIFKSTHYRLPSGRFGVMLPFLPDATPLGSNKYVALKCYERLERKLTRNQSLADAYASCLSEYISLGHMSLSTDQVEYFLPHHAVVKESSSSTKVRVVYNCSAPDNQGLSLNDRLYKGPTLLNDIASLLTNFRMFKVAITCDLKMMYRFVEVHPDHRKYLSIIWRSLNDPESETPAFYHMNRVTFGLKPAGYLAGRCVLELASNHQDEFPLAASAIFQNRYCDDFLGGASSVCEGQRLQRELTQLLARGEFEIRKWCSNESDALEAVMEEHKEETLELPTGGLGVKVLGVSWDPSEDIFVATVENFQPTVITKRTVLSHIAKLYDIVGFYTPIIFIAKIFIQKLWLEKLGWDDPLREDLAQEWLEFASDLKNLSEIKIPRHIPVLDGTIRLVGFSDASELGMAAAVYVHIDKGDGIYESCLIRAKSKVAPLKTLTIPRLELSGSLLLAKLVKSIVSGSQIHFESITLFTDSTIVLSWLRQPLHLLKTYVCNRVSQIQDCVPNGTWRHVSTSLNSADVGSRGMRGSDLKSCRLWWSGPSFLQSGPDQWPDNSILPPPELPEMKTVQALNVTVEESLSSLEELLIKFSSLEKLQRVMAYVLRFVHAIKNKSQRRTGVLTAAELNKALVTCVRVAQEQDFKEDLQKIKKGKLDKVNPQIRKLAPFYDESDCVVRVGGRLAEAHFMPFKTRHPILLSKSSHLSIIICDSYHRALLHSGPRSTFAAIRRKFWITSLMVLVRSRLHRCTTCLRWNGKPAQPIMSNVPVARMKPTSCWVSTSMDFGGPFMVKESNKRKSTLHKTYICVFVCLTTRAVHIEMVTDLTAEAFLAAYQRFTSRRSVPERIYSDNGTNFVKGRSLLREFRDFLKENEDHIMSAAAAMGTKWILNAPAYPNANGCAENCIKRAKSLIKKIVGDQVYTFEQFSTFLCRVEQILNSTPITFTSEDANEQDLCYLTPGHFITGRELLCAPEKPEDDSLSITDRWQRVRHMSQVFWKTYFKSYLNDLVQRNKWTKSVENIKEGDLVYVTSQDTSPLTWPIGRVTRAFKSTSDTAIRVVQVRIRGKDYTRPVNRLIIFPTDPEPVSLSSLFGSAVRQPRP